MCSVVSDSLKPHGLQPTRLLCPLYFPGKHTGVGCHALLQGIEPGSPASPPLAGRFFTTTTWEALGVNTFFFLITLELFYGDFGRFPIKIPFKIFNLKKNKLSFAILAQISALCLMLLPQRTPWSLH